MLADQAKQQNCRKGIDQMRLWTRLFTRTANLRFFEAPFCNLTLFEAQLHEIAAVTPPILEVFFQSAYFGIVIASWV